MKSVPFFDSGSLLYSGVYNKVKLLPLWLLIAVCNNHDSISVAYLERMEFIIIIIY